MNNIKAICTLQTTYPDIKIEKSNVRYANMLMPAYSGDKGELTAVLQYTYGHIVTMNVPPEIFTQTLECVSLTEMRHFEMLGELILQLGGNPLLCGPRGCYNASRVSRAANPSRIINDAIASENEAIKEYNRLINSIDDRYVVAILKRIVLDEEHHIKLFTELQNDIR